MLKPFDGIHFFLMFIGCPYSGHSLIGSLLDAHPHMIIAHEYNLLAKLEKSGGDNAVEDVFRGLYKNSRSHKGKRIQTGYDYTVPHQFQGAHRDPLRVIGDKKGGDTTLKFIENHGAALKIFDAFKAKIKIPVKLIHVTRNPYDNISAMALHAYAKRKKTNYSQLPFDPDNPLRDRGLLNEKTDRYFQHAKKNMDLLKSGMGDGYTLRSENFIKNPEKELKKICSFLGQPADEGYLEDCASIVYDKPHKSRFRVRWTQEMIKKTALCIEEYDFLSGRRYDE
ncbi:conserved hypothetical protein [Candidatus Desulfarcum epimagneticum]|uniref:Sulfotransferase n=1 Tax=uncultured Desulfobacteraceae bacterium TaxID=218296 RepID=A0A484HK90_9BACT|nr:conserved hypothetical protein [uncultured Desulfobacteraceae bacterium]